MKRIVLLSLFCAVLSFSQTQIFTQDANSKYKNYSAATTGDTLISSGAAPAGSSIVNESTRGYVVGILIGTPVSKDTIQLKNGVNTITSIILDSTYTSGESFTRYTTPIWVPIGARVDTSLIFIQKKTSNTTVIYQLRRP